jgi:hypothetical protein
MMTEAVGGADGARWLRSRLGFLSCRRPRGNFGEKVQEGGGGKGD